MAKIEACEAVIVAIDKASKVLANGFRNKVNATTSNGESDFSGPITIPLQQLMNTASVYFKAVQAGHGAKKAVKTLGKQLEKLHSINDDNGESFRVVLELLKPKT